MKLYPVIIAIILQLTVAACAPYEDPADRNSSVPLEKSKETIDEKEEEKKVKQPENVIAMYKEHVHPVLTQYCHGCHGKDRAPLFAVEDANESYGALLENAKIDLKNLKRSRIYLRLASDQHNCWSTCEKSATELLSALETFVSKIDAIEEPKNKLPTTITKTFSDAVLVEPVVTDLRTIVLPAESGKRSGGWIIEDQDTALGGKKILVKNGVIPDSISTAANSNDLVTYDVNLSEPGTYRLYLRTNAPSTQDDELHYAFNDLQFQNMIVPQTTTTGFVWVRANQGDLAKPAPGTVLKAGKHTIKIKRLEAGISIDMIAVTKDVDFEGANQGTFEKIPVIEYDLSSVCDIPGAKFSIEVFDFNKQAYKMKNPRIVTPKSLKISGINILVNGEKNPQYATFSQIDRRIEPNTGLGEVVASGSLMVLYDQGAAKDTFAFTFASCGLAE